MQNRQTYIIIIALVSLSLSAIVGAVNWVVDPYGLFKSPIELALVKPEIYNYERELKVHSVTQQRANGLVLGASTSSVGLDPAHPGWKADRVYNMAVGQASISTAYMFLLHASKFEMPIQVVLGVELAMFNPALQNLVGLAPDALAAKENGEPNSEYSAKKYYGKLLSRSMLWSSVTSIMATLKNKSPNNISIHLVGDDGLLNSEALEYKSWKTWRKHFQLNVKNHIVRFWAKFDGGQTQNDLYASKSFDAYRNIIRFACENDIDLYIVVSPVHAYLAEAVRFAGLQPVWGYWQESLVIDADAEAQKYGCEPFPVWDFSGYNDITTETIPASVKPEDAPRWYWDSAHYKKEAGDRVLERIFSGGSDDYGFGVRIDRHNIKKHLSDTQISGAQYARGHIEEVEAVRETAQSNSEILP
jgi:hypothetical protein